jgi:quercetin dioxygenase-like cupin family protein
MPNNYITSHNKEGKATFTDKVASEQIQIPLFPGGSLDSGSLQCIYYSDRFLPDLSTEADIEQYVNVRANGLPPGQYAPPSGFIINVITLAPDWESPWHQTSTLNTLVVVEGVMELYLDGGEFCSLEVGDSVVQRGTNHRWKNVTPNGGVVRMLAVSQRIAETLETE